MEIYEQQVYKPEVLAENLYISKVASVTCSSDVEKLRRPLVAGRKNNIVVNVSCSLLKKRCIYSREHTAYAIRSQNDK